VEYDRPASLYSIDLVKAFTILELNAVLEILEIKNVPNSLFSLIKDIYVNNFIRIRSHSKTFGKDTSK
jgi:hypothetical protein